MIEKSIFVIYIDFPILIIPSSCTSILRMHGSKLLAAIQSMTHMFVGQALFCWGGFFEMLILAFWMHAFKKYQINIKICMA